MPSPAGRLLALLLLAAPALARAQLQPLYDQFDVQSFHPRPMAECSLSLGCAEAGPAGALRLAASVLYVGKPLVVMSDGTVGGGGFGGGQTAGSAVSYRYALDLAVAWAPLDGLEVHAEMPVFNVQAGNSLDYLGVPSPGAWGTGTPLVGARWTMLSERRGAPLALAVGLDLMAPVGWKPALDGNAGWMAAPRLEVAHWFDAGVVALDLGAELRQTAVRVGDDLLRNRLTWEMGVAGRSAPLRAEAVLRGISGGQAATTAFELLLGCRLALKTGEAFIMAGPGFRNAIGFAELRAMIGYAWGHGLPPVLPPPPEEPDSTNL